MPKRKKDWLDELVAWWRSVDREQWESFRWRLPMLNASAVDSLAGQIKVALEHEAARLKAAQKSPGGMRGRRSK